MLWLRGYPLYAAHVLVMFFVASMLVTTLLMGFNAQNLLAQLVFSSESVLRGQLWRMVTYGLVNPPSLWFIVDMFMIVWFGREVEKAFGRRAFLRLYGCLYVLPPLLFTAIGLWRPTQLAGQTGGFGLFIAFVALYPNLPMIFNLLAKWVAAILVGIYTLMALSKRDGVALISLWTTVGFAYAYVRAQQGRLPMPSFKLPKRGPKLRVLPDLPSAKNTARDTPKTTSMAEIDALLDKIAQSGLSSLSAAERAQLDAARAGLLKKDPTRR